MVWYKRIESLDVIASTIKVDLCVNCYTTNNAVVKESKSTYKSKLKCVLCENGQNNGSLIVLRNLAKGCLAMLEQRWMMCMGAR